MAPIETLEDFYNSHPAMEMPPVMRRAGQGGHFSVYPREGVCHTSTNYHRRDFFKISLIIGDGTLRYVDKWITIKGSALLFTNPNIAYSWQAAPGKQTGYFCLFNEDFIHGSGGIGNLPDSPLSRIGGDMVYFINPQQVEIISSFFVKMIAEMASDYIYKYDVLRNYVHLVIHEALRLQPATDHFKHSNASSRITTLFVDLLERQFPIESSDHVLKLKTAADYSEMLTVHVNHLNRAVREVTGKTTTTHIAERVVKEAKAMLKHTDWNISEIGYCLGFEEATHFNNFFKKQTQLTPSSFRNV